MATAETKYRHKGEVAPMKAKANKVLKLLFSTFLLLMIPFDLNSKGKETIWKNSALRNFALSKEVYHKMSEKLVISNFIRTTKNMTNWNN